MLTSDKFWDGVFIVALIVSALAIGYSVVMGPAPLPVVEGTATRVSQATVRYDSTCMETGIGFNGQLTTTSVDCVERFSGTVVAVAQQEDKVTYVLLVY